MVVFFYTDKNCEFQAKYCVESIVPRMKKNDKLVYFTVGFSSNLSYDNLTKIRIPYKDYPTFHYYKAELSLAIMDYFPEEEHFCFTDTDIVFSKRLDFEKIKSDTEYPLASMGPHEFPFIYEDLKPHDTVSEGVFKGMIRLKTGEYGMPSNDIIIYDEVPCSKYFNVQERTMRYVWSCFYTFNRSSRDYFEEYVSMCQNKYLQKHRKWVFPFHDETAFNVCLWKRGANKNLGYAFVNTHNVDFIKKIETEESTIEKETGKNLDGLGANWEYVHNSNDVMFYHGIKDEETFKESIKVVI